MMGNMDRWIVGELKMSFETNEIEVMIVWRTNFRQWSNFEVANY